MFTFEEIFAIFGLIVFCVVSLCFEMRGREKDICVQLDLQKKQHEGKLIAVIENKNSNANFILSSILNYNLKNNVGAVFISLCNALSHYQHVGVKLGYNLKQSIESGQVIFVDMLNVAREALLKSEDSSCEVMTGETLVQWLLMKISTNLEKLLEKHNSVFIYIDDCSILLSLGVALKQAQAFVHYLQVLAMKNTTKVSPEKTCSVVILSHLETEDDEASKLAAAILHASISQINVTETRCIVSHTGQ